MPEKVSKISRDRELKGLFYEWVFFLRLSDDVHLSFHLTLVSIKWAHRSMRFRLVLSSLAPKTSNTKSASCSRSKSRRNRWPRSPPKKRMKTLQKGQKTISSFIRESKWKVSQPSPFDWCPVDENVSSRSTCAVHSIKRRTLLARRISRNEEFKSNCNYCNVFSETDAIT